MTIPFPIRRIWLLIRGALVDRDNPRLDHLSSIDDPERFVWAILPHAARSFAPSILLLPVREARASAVAYLYARMLDTYEDLSSTPSQAREALDAFANRFDHQPLQSAPVAPSPENPDQRDNTHLLLIDRHQLVDEVYADLDSETQARIARLVREMAVGMGEFSEVFERQGGVLETQQQVLDYCGQVIGLPALFVMGLVFDDLSDGQRQDALEVAELIQLANITRDVEKDLKLGVAYHPSLKPFLGSINDESSAEVVDDARRELTLLAIQRAPSFRRLIRGVRLPRISAARSAAVMMMLFTSRHYRGMTRDIETPQGVTSMVMTSIPAAFSPRWTERVLLQAETELLAAA